MHAGLCTISNRDADVDAVLAHAANAGYDGVEVWGATTWVTGRWSRAALSDVGLATSG